MSEQSKVTVGLAIMICVLAFWTGVAWSKIGNLESAQTDYSKTVQAIDTRLSHIEGKLGVGDDK